METQSNNELHNQEDVNPSTQLDKLVTEDKEQLPETNGTGANRPVPTVGSVVIKEDEEDAD
jgi:hypothetical protein